MNARLLVEQEADEEVRAVDDGCALVVLRVDTANEDSIMFNVAEPSTEVIERRSDGERRETSLVVFSVLFVSLSFLFVLCFYSCFFFFFSPFLLSLVLFPFP